MADEQHEQHPEWVPAEDQQMGWVAVCTRGENSSITSVHQVPREEFTHWADADGTCICGPWRIDGAMTMFRHAALDERYYDEDFLEYWEP